MRTPWEVLGIPVGATPTEIKAAHRRLTWELHPDRSTAPDAHRRTAEVNDAAAVLLAALRGWVPDAEPEPVRPSTALVRARHRNPWDAAVAPEPVRGALADLAA